MRRTSSVDSEARRPVVVDANGTIDIYPDALSAIANMEAIDVEAGECEVFDTTGRRLELTIVSGKILIGPSADDQDYLTRVDRSVRAFAKRIGRRRLSNIDPDLAKLDDVISAILAI